MKITERRSPYSNRLEFTYYEIDEKEFAEMPKEEKIQWLRGRPNRNVKRIGGCHIVRIKGLIGWQVLKEIDENTLLLRNKEYKKFLFNLNTCEKTPISQAEYKKMTDRVGFLKNKRQNLLEELAKIEAEIAMLENE